MIENEHAKDRIKNDMGNKLMGQKMFLITDTLNHKLGCAVEGTELALIMLKALASLNNVSAIYTHYKIDDEPKDKILYSTLKGVRVTLKDINKVIDEIMEAEDLE